MASTQSEAVRQLWSSWMEAARANPNETPEDVRASVEHWGDLTAEPDGVDYVEIEVAGLPALWAILKGSAEDRVVLSFHGGGFVSGSITTHVRVHGPEPRALADRADPPVGGSPVEALAVTAPQDRSVVTFTDC